jgi:nitrite reductase/ring-hydroxylating ferredoxin subunit
MEAVLAAKQVLPVLVKDGIGVLGMKPLGGGAIVQSGAVSAIECLHFTLNLPTSVVITGMESLARMDQALEAVRTFKKMSEAEVASLLAKTAPLAATGQYERFKTSAGFDGICTHGHAHLADGLVKGKLIECPKHNGRFDITDGSPQPQPVCVALKTYPALEHEGKIFLNLLPPAATVSPSPSATYKFRVVSNDFFCWIKVGLSDGASVRV